MPAGVLDSLRASRFSPFSSLSRRTVSALRLSLSSSAGDDRVSGARRLCLLVGGVGLDGSRASHTLSPQWRRPVSRRRLAGRAWLPLLNIAGALSRYTPEADNGPRERPTLAAQAPPRRLAELLGWKPLLSPSQRKACKLQYSLSQDLKGAWKCGNGSAS
jgi:hypothetical protein